MMKRCSLLMLVVLSAWCSFATPTISDVKVTPVAPWGMAIDYTVSGAVSGDTNMTVCVTATGGGKSYLAKSLTGDTRCVNGAHRVMWNMAKDGITATVANGTVSVGFQAYCVIDLSGGANAKSYPVSYLSSEPSGGFNVAAYKTTKLVLKYLPAGAYKMQNVGSVTLTKPFFMGLFEVTQKQWSLVMGSNPSSSSGDALPVEWVSYDDIRGASQGAQWPTSNAVDASSFLGKLRARTGIAFDLPTEAQWEYACRAGTTTTYSYGNGVNGDYMWYRENSSSQTHEVGMKQPNLWGLYDLHGNVAEWCLDWLGNLSYGKDPKGSSVGDRRVSRGGMCYSTAHDCTSSGRGWGYSVNRSEFDGFRLALTLP